MAVQINYSNSTVQDNGTLSNDVYIKGGCVSTDSKPTNNIAVGSELIEADTGKTFMYSGSAWVEQPSSGGGSGLPTPADDGMILFSVNGNWAQEYIRNSLYPLQEIYVNFDGQSFSLDTTKTSASDLSPSKYEKTVCTYIYVEAGSTIYPFPAHISLTNGFSTATYQTSVVLLDSIGLTGNVGYLCVDHNSEGLVTVCLFYWPASSM